MHHARIVLSSTSMMRMGRELPFLDEEAKPRRIAGVGQSVPVDPGSTEPNYLKLL